jgi:hypothetical protein
VIGSQRDLISRFFLFIFSKDAQGLQYGVPKANEQSESAAFVARSRPWTNKTSLRAAKHRQDARMLAKNAL